MTTDIEAPAVEPIICLADLVVDCLNAESMGLAAQRAYSPVFDRATIKDDEYKVFVIAAGEDSQANSRSSTTDDFKIDVGVIRVLPKPTDASTALGLTFNPADVDECLRVVRSVKQLMRFNRLGRFTWIRTENEPIYNHEHLEQFRQFTSVVTLTYRVSG